MKLSTLKVGDLLKFHNINPLLCSPIIIVSDTFYMEKNVDTNEIVYFNIKCYRIFKDYTHKETFNLNRMTPEEVLNDNYDANLTPFDPKDLPLYINEPKTKWFDIAMQNTIRGYGTTLHDRMLSFLHV